MRRTLAALAILGVLVGSLTSCALATQVADRLSPALSAPPAAVTSYSAAGETAAGREPTIAADAANATGVAASNGSVAPQPEVTPESGSTVGGTITGPSRASSPNPSQVADELFVLVNEERSRNGLSALARDASLDALAQEYAASGLDDAVLERSDLRFLMTNSWWMVFRGGSPRFDRDTAADQLAYCLSEERTREALLEPEARSTGLGVAVVGDSVYYSQAFDVVATRRGDGTAVALDENPQAQDPSWEALIAFLDADPTDSQTYADGAFVCVDFAEMLHNNAERAGIRAAYVAVELAEGPGHALNAFMVAGREVYVDAIGGDKVACVKPGRPFGVMSLEAAGRYTCDGFDLYASEVEQYLADSETYSAAVREYNGELAEYDAAVLAYNARPSDQEYERLSGWSSDLERRGAELDAWDAGLRAVAERLGLSETYWDPIGSLAGAGDAPIVGVYIHW